MKNILITGASGFLCKELSKKLHNKGYNIKHLSTKKIINSNFNTYYWNIKKDFIDLDSIRYTDIIIHLAGVPIDSKRWNIKHKKDILNSRLLSMNLLLKGIKILKRNINTFILASGVGYYGYNNLNKILCETDNCGKDFLSYVSNTCESKSKIFNNLGVRTIIIRSGIILSKKCKILNIMYKMTKYYLGAKIGNGNQFIPWIDIDDLCDIYVYMIEKNNLYGIYNAVAEEQITNKIFIKKLAHILNKPLILNKIPSFLIKILYGEISTVILNGNPISNQKLLKSGFIFKYPNLYESLIKIFDINK